MIRNVVFGLITLLILGECTLRWGVGLGDPPLARLDPETEYELVPSATYTRWHNRVDINAHGMRTAEHLDQPDTKTRHLLLIGDSVVYGGHFLDQSETIAVQLETLLATEVQLEGCDIRALPMAVSSWGPVNQAAFLNRHGSFGAQTAGIIVSAHDLFDVPRDESDILPYRTAAPWTATGDAVQAILERYYQRTKNGVDIQPRAIRRQQSLRALSRTIDLLIESGTTPVVIYHPTTPERQGETRVAKTAFEELAKTRQVTFFDLGGTPMQEGDYRDTIHPTHNGARRIAQALVPVLGANLSPCAN